MAALELRAGDGATIEQEIFVDRDGGDTVLRWRASGVPEGSRLQVRPLISGRDYHSLHRENGAFDFAPTVRGRNVAWRPYPDLPAIGAITNGSYRHDPQWYRNFLYREEQARGLDHIEDLASPGAFAFDLQAGDAVLILRAGDAVAARAAALAERLASAERARRAALPSLDLAADAYLVDRGAGRTIIAGFPWFTDWGRDTFIAMRGLAIATGRLDDAEAILTAWSGVVSEGMLPNVFPDRGEVPEYNAVDASLWFCIAVHDFLQAAAAAGRPVSHPVAGRLRDAVGAILAGYERGTRFGIGIDARRAARAPAQPGVQLTWMDAKVDDWVVTPRIGKPVEIQALWINALIAAAWRPDKRPRSLPRPGPRVRRALLESRGRLPARRRRRRPRPRHGRRALRPNQIFAVGGLPFAAARRRRGARDRRRASNAAAHAARPALARTRPTRPTSATTGATARERDAAYHQGTVWPWLIGPFVDAWLRVHGDDRRRRAPRPRHASCRRSARTCDAAGLGHVSEIADGEPPHTPGGCPFQAWSVGELMRCERAILSKRAGA